MPSGFKPQSIWFAHKLPSDFVQLWTSIRRNGVEESMVSDIRVSSREYQQREKDVQDASIICAASGFHSLATALVSGSHVV